MGSFGAKGSVPGFDVLSAVDYLLQFSSSWPLLKVEASGSASITRNASPQTIYTHNLGYPPLYFIITGGAFEANVGLSGGIGVNGSDLAYDGSLSSGAGYSFYYYVFRLPLDQPFTAPQISGTTATSAVDRDIGFKVAKPGKSVDSTDLRDYSLHSSSRSLMVHQVDSGVATDNGLDFVRSVSHTLGYVPFGFSFMKPSTNTDGKDTSRYYLLPPADAGVASASYSVSSSSISMRADNLIFTTTPTVSTVILKDPFSKTVINVSFP